MWGPLLQEQRSQTAGAGVLGPKEQRGGWGLRLGPEGSVSRPLPSPALCVLSLSGGYLLTQGPHASVPQASCTWGLDRLGSSS